MSLCDSNSYIGKYEYIYEYVLSRLNIQCTRILNKQLVRYNELGTYIIHRTHQLWAKKYNNLHPNLAT